MNSVFRLKFSSHHPQTLFFDISDYSIWTEWGHVQRSVVGWALCVGAESLSVWMDKWSVETRGGGGGRPNCYSRSVARKLHPPPSNFSRPICNVSIRTQSSSDPLATKLFNWNFHPLEVVSRWRDPQLQMSENYWDQSCTSRLWRLSTISIFYERAVKKHFSLNGVSAKPRIL